KKPTVQQQKKEESSSSESSSDSISEFKSSGLTGYVPNKRPRSNMSSSETSVISSPPSKKPALDRLSLTDVPTSVVKSSFKRPTDTSVSNSSPILLKRPRTDDIGNENKFDSRKSLPARLSNGNGDTTVYPNKSSTQSPKVNAPFLRYANRAPESVHFFQGDNFHSRRQLLGEVGERADRNLLGTRGKSFRHEKTKEKRGTRSNGPISTKVASYQFKY
ncbi:unnamed protein product, partial [Hymenolepis diminuta]|uniref:SRP40_C domain-containing protein n=1 Tax=Hymenolepis diminuta TaxID=6216 RepID=A0A0R3STX1_HYMDI